MRGHEQCTQSGAQRHCRKQRDTYSDSHSQAELSVERTGGAAHKAHRDEHRHKHHSGGEQSRGDTTHAFDRGIVCRLDPFVELSLHRLHHHYGIVDHRAYHKHKGKERDEIEAEPSHIQEYERTDERHHYRQCGDNGGPEALKEYVHHKHHEKYRLDKSLDHIVDRSVKKILGAHEIDHHHPFGEGLADIVHLLVDSIDYLIGVGAGCLGYHTCSAGLAVDCSEVFIGPCTELYLSHIL